MSYRHTVIGTIGSGRDFKIAEEETLDRIAELGEDHREIIDGPVTVILVTRRRDGRPMMSPVWTRAAPGGDRFEINTVRGRIKDHHLRRDPSVAFHMLDPGNAYHWMTVYGEAEERIEESDPERGHLATESIDELSRTYVNQYPYAYRVEGEERVLYYVRPKQIVTFGAP
jgi:PPOX class probable F420-dependent enzyme